MRLDQKGLQTLVALGSLGAPRPRAPTFNGPRPNIAIGALIVSPAAARDRLNSVNTQVNTLDSEIKTNVTRPAFLSSWNEFKGNWQKNTAKVERIACCR